MKKFLSFVLLLVITTTVIAAPAKPYFSIPITAFAVGEVQGGGIGLQRTFRNRVAFSAQLLFSDNNTISSFSNVNTLTTVTTVDRCFVGKHDEDCSSSTKTSTKTSATARSSGGRDVGLALTLSIPLRRR